MNALQVFQSKNGSSTEDTLSWKNSDMHFSSSDLVSCCWSSLGLKLQTKRVVEESESSRVSRTKVWSDQVLVLMEEYSVFISSYWSMRNKSIRVQEQSGTERKVKSLSLVFRHLHASYNSWKWIKGWRGGECLFREAVKSIIRYSVMCEILQSNKAPCCTLRIVRSRLLKKRN